MLFTSLIGGLGGVSLSPAFLYSRYFNASSVKLPRLVVFYTNSHRLLFPGFRFLSPFNEVNPPLRARAQTCAAA